MTDLLPILRGLEGLVLLLGISISFAALRAYYRTRQRSLGLLGAGFVLVTVAAALAGVLFELVTHDLLSAWVVSAALDAAGFALILAAVLGPRIAAHEAPGPGGAGLAPDDAAPPPAPPG